MTVPIAETTAPNRAARIGLRLEGVVDALVEVSLCWDASLHPSANLQRWCAGDASGASGVALRLYLSTNCGIGDATVPRSKVEASSLRKNAQSWRAERALVLSILVCVEILVIRPKLVLLISAHRADR